MNASELVEHYKKTMPDVEFRIVTRETPEFTTPKGYWYPSETTTTVLRVNHCPRCGREDLNVDHSCSWVVCDCPEEKVIYKQGGATAEELDEQFWDRDA